MYMLRYFFRVQTHGSVRSEFIRFEKKRKRNIFMELSPLGYAVLSVATASLRAILLKRIIKIIIIIMRRAGGPVGACTRVWDLLFSTFLFAYFVGVHVSEKCPFALAGDRLMYSTPNHRVGSL